MNEEYDSDTLGEYRTKSRALEVSKYDYEIVFKPQSIIPIKFDYQE